MFDKLKNYIKTKPRLYDVLNSKRPIADEMEKWLNNFSINNNRHVNFIQIGASDGLRWDPFRRFIIRDGWNGVFVEPLPIVFDILKYNYAYVKNQNLKFVNTAISIDDREYIDIWSYSKKFCDSLPLEEKLFYLRKSSLNRRHVEKSLEGIDGIEDIVECYRVNCTSINTLIKQYWNNSIDLILIDAEGHDDKIVRAIGLDVIKPKAILFEAHSLEADKRELYDYLMSNGYKVLELGGDSVATRI